MFGRCDWKKRCTLSNGKWNNRYYVDMKQSISSLLTYIPYVAQLPPAIIYAADPEELHYSNTYYAEMCGFFSVITPLFRFVVPAAARPAEVPVLHVAGGHRGRTQRGENDKHPMASVAATSLCHYSSAIPNDCGFLVLTAPNFGIPFRAV